MPVGTFRRIGTDFETDRRRSKNDFIRVKNHTGIFI